MPKKFSVHRLDNFFFIIIIFFKHIILREVKSVMSYEKMSSGKLIVRTKCNEIFNLQYTNPSTNLQST